MAFNEHSSPSVTSDASEALRDPNASEREKRLAASVLTQAPDRRHPQSLLDYLEIETAKLHMEQGNAVLLALGDYRNALGYFDKY